VGLANEFKFLFCKHTQMYSLAYDAVREAVKYYKFWGASALIPLLKEDLNEIPSLIRKSAEGPVTKHSKPTKIDNSSGNKSSPKTDTGKSKGSGTKKSTETNESDSLKSESPRLKEIRINISDSSDRNNDSSGLSPREKLDKSNTSLKLSQKHKHTNASHSRQSSKNEEGE